MIDLPVLTQSQLSAFRNCRQLAYWRYEAELVPIREDEVLSFGKLIHQMLEAEYAGTEYPDEKGFSEDDWARAMAMMEAYSEHWADKDRDLWSILAVEKVFRNHPIRNPETGKATPSFGLSGRVDMVVKDRGQVYIVEHKTTSRIDQGYLEKLWCDYQIMIYAKAIEQELAQPIAGVIYNILEKPQLRRYEVNKSHPNGETAKEFQARCLAAMREPGKFHRELILFSQADLAKLRDEQWELQKQYRDCQLRHRWYENRSYCWHWGKPCAYWNLCRSGGSKIVKESQYKHQPKHSELSEPSPAVKEKF